MLEGDKNSYLPRGSRLDEQNPAVRSCLLIWRTNKALDKMNDISRTLPSLVFAVYNSIVCPKAQQVTAKRDLSVNLCERYVFGGSLHCGPIQCSERRTPISNPVYVYNLWLAIVAMPIDCAHYALCLKRLSTACPSWTIMQM